jgi:hypothetical protein
MYRDHPRLHTIAVELQAPSPLLNDESVYCTAIILAIAVGIFKSVSIKLFKVRGELLQVVLAKEAVYWERKTCKSFNLKTIAHVSYLLFFRIHGHGCLWKHRPIPDNVLLGHPWKGRNSLTKETPSMARCV